MPELTPKIGLKKPLGHERVTRASYNENLDLIDQSFTSHDSDSNAHNGLIGKLENINTQTTTLSRGFNVINALEASSLDAKVKGRTLVNLLGKDGNFETDSNADGKSDGWAFVGTGTWTLDTDCVIGTKAQKCVNIAGQFARGAKTITLTAGKYYLYMGRVKSSVIGEAYISASTTAACTLADTWQNVYVKEAGNGNAVEFRAGFAQTGQACTSFVDGVALYEVSQSIYNLIDVDPEYTGEKLAEKFPYVDSLQNLKGLGIRGYGKNLINEKDWLKDSHVSLTGDYLTLSNYTGGILLSRPAVAGQSYTLSAVGYSSVVTANVISLVLVFYDSQGNLLSEDVSVLFKNYTVPTSASGTVVAPANTATLAVYPIAQVDTFYWKNVQVELGSTATEFEPYNEDWLLFGNVELASNVDGSVIDTIAKVDSDYVKQNRFKKVTLDGSLAVAFDGDYAGYKRIMFTSPFLDETNKGALGKITGVKYDGKIVVGVSATTAADQFQTSGADSRLYLTITDTDSGWGESYTPSADEIKKYFMGWKMCSDDGTTVYTSGTKRWASVAKTYPIALIDTTTALPTEEDDTVDRYVLQYQLATPVQENLPNPNGIAFHKGLNQVELLKGVVVREIASPYLASGWYYINRNADGDTSPLNYRALRMFAVYKNGLPDNKWTIEDSATGAYGKQRAKIIAADFDPTAQYSVTYEVLDKYLYSPNIISADASYQGNLAETVRANTQNIADVKEAVSMIENWMENVAVKGDGERIEVGSVSITVSNAQFATATITFKRTFTIPPKVVVSMSAGGANFFAAADAVTNTGFTMYLSYKLASNVTATKGCSWIAIGK